MKLRFFQQVYFVSGLAPSLIAVLAGSLVHAQEAVESEESVRSRSPLLYVEAPVLVEDGVNPVMPLRARLASPELDPESDPAFGQRSDSIRRYNIAVTYIELDGGAWDGGLVEELASLGRLQQQQGNHIGAIQTLDRAIHVNRINSGLYTLEQIPVVEQLIQSHMALGDWEEADIYNNYLYHVQQKAYGFDDPRLIPVLERLATWNIQAFKIGHGSLLGIKLRQSQIMFNAAARMVDVHFGKADERFINYQRNIASSAYLAAKNPDLMSQIDKSEYRTRQQVFAKQMNEQRQVQPSGFRTGERALLEVVMFYQEQGYGTYVLAEAITHLADWYLIFGRRQSALKIYKLAWDMLQGLEDSEELTQQLFGSVTPLPAFGSSIEVPDAFYRTEDGSQALRFDYADLTFDVTENGLARNVVSISEETEDNQAQLGKLRNSTRSTHFRPLVIDGEPQRSFENHFRYRYWY
jgi:tetratricopeptide (TPR) repeat protein